METLNIPHIKHGLCPEYKISLKIARNIASHRPSYCKKKSETFIEKYCLK